MRMNALGAVCATRQRTSRRDGMAIAQEAEIRGISRGSHGQLEIDEIRDQNLLPLTLIVSPSIIHQHCSSASA